MRAAHAVSVLLLSITTAATAMSESSSRRLLALAPDIPSSIVTTILNSNAPAFTIGAPAPQREPVPEAPGLHPEPTSRVNGNSQVLFACRAIGQQIYTPGSNGTYENTGAQADLWCGPSSTSKIAIKHFFSSKAADGTHNEAFVGGSPTFLAVDGTALVVAKKLTTLTPAPERSGDGGFGSVPDTLLQETEAEGFFSDVTFIVRNNELGGALPSGLTPLAINSDFWEHFGPTGGEGKPNAALFIPYQADYYFFTGHNQPTLMSGVYSNAPSPAPSAGTVTASGR